MKPQAVCLTEVLIHGSLYWAPALYYPKGTQNDAGQLAEWAFATRLYQFQASNEMLIARSRGIEAAEELGLRFLDQVVNG